jgi:hypothetical protein
MRGPFPCRPRGQTGARQGGWMIISIAGGVSVHPPSRIRPGFSCLRVRDALLALDSRHRWERPFNLPLTGASLQATLAPSLPFSLSPFLSSPRSLSHLGQTLLFSGEGSPPLSWLAACLPFLFSRAARLFFTSPLTATSSYV